MNYGSLELSREYWKFLSSSGRIEALNGLEEYLASLDGRKPVIVESSEKLESDIDGRHYFDDCGVEKIDINSRLIINPEPYEAVETLFHEDRHSYQNDSIKYLDPDDKKSILNDWKLNLHKDGYIRGDEFNYNYPEYRWQPIEKDAFEVARERTDDLYENTYHDTEYYQEYKEIAERGVEKDKEVARFSFGEEFIEEARLRMIEKYQQEHQVFNAADINLSNNIDANNEPSENQTGYTNEQIQDLRLNNSSNLPEESEGDDYKYNYGY
jgi:hypothetical protein